MSSHSEAEEVSELDAYPWPDAADCDFTEIYEEIDRYPDKMVFTGDIFQIDQPYLDQWSNGLTHLEDKLSGQKIFQHIFLRKGERSRLSEMAAKLL